MQCRGPFPPKLVSNDVLEGHNGMTPLRFVSLL